jgi:Legionella pneumophila major outer membrane protein precursor
MKLIATLLIASSAASAFIGNCDSQFWGEAQALYWRPSHCPIAYVRGEIDGDDLDVVADRFVQADYDWGFRLGFGFDGDCSTSGVTYLYLQTTDEARTRAKSEAEQLELQGQGSADMDEARSALKFRYQNVDLKYYQRFHQSCGCSFGVTAAVRWADIELRNRSVGLFDDGATPRVFDQSASFDGTGIAVGFAGDFCLPCDFKIGGHFDFAALIGSRKIGKTVSKAAALTTRRGNGVSSFVPGGQFDLFISYSRCLCRALWNLKLGYEMHYYWSALRYATGHEDENNLPLLGCYDVGFGGPYLGLSASF